MSTADALPQQAILPPLQGQQASARTAVSNAVTSVSVSQQEESEGQASEQASEPAAGSTGEAHDAPSPRAARSQVSTAVSFEGARAAGSAVQPERSVDEDSALSAAEADGPATRSNRPQQVPRPANSLISTAVHPTTRNNNQHNHNRGRGPVEQYASSQEVNRTHSFTSHAAAARGQGAALGLHHYHHPQLLQAPQQHSPALQQDAVRGARPASVYGQLHAPPPLPPAQSARKQGPLGQANLSNGLGGMDAATAAAAAVLLGNNLAGWGLLPAALDGSGAGAQGAGGSGHGHALGNPFLLAGGPAANGPQSALANTPFGYAAISQLQALQLQAMQASGGGGFGAHGSPPMALPASNSAAGPRHPTNARGRGAPYRVGASDAMMGAGMGAAPPSSTPSTSAGGERSGSHQGTMAPGGLPPSGDQRRRYGARSVAQSGDHMGLPPAAPPAFPHHLHGVHGMGGQGQDYGAASAGMQDSGDLGAAMPGHTGGPAVQQQQQQTPQQQTDFAAALQSAAAAAAAAAAATAAGNSSGLDPAPLNLYLPLNLALGPSMALTDLAGSVTSQSHQQAAAGQAGLGPGGLFAANDNAAAADGPGQAVTAAGANGPGTAQGMAASQHGRMQAPGGSQHKSTGSGGNDGRPHSPMHTDSVAQPSGAHAHAAGHQAQGHAEHHGAAVSLANGATAQANHGQAGGDMGGEAVGSPTGQLLGNEDGSAGVSQQVSNQVEAQGGGSGGGAAAAAAAGGQGAPHMQLHQHLHHQQFPVAAMGLHLGNTHNSGPYGAAPSMSHTADYRSQLQVALSLLFQATSAAYNSQRQSGVADAGAGEASGIFAGAAGQGAAGGNEPLASNSGAADMAGVQASVGPGGNGAGFGHNDGAQSAHAHQEAPAHSGGPMGQGGYHNLKHSMGEVGDFGREAGQNGPEETGEGGARHALEEQASGYPGGRWSGQGQAGSPGGGWHGLAPSNRSQQHGSNGQAAHAVHSSRQPRHEDQQDDAPANSPGAAGPAMATVHGGDAVVATAAEAVGAARIAGASVGSGGLLAGEGEQADNNSALELAEADGDGEAGHPAASVHATVIAEDSEGSEGGGGGPGEDSGSMQQAMAGGRAGGSNRTAPMADADQEEIMSQRFGGSRSMDRQGSKQASKPPAASMPAAGVGSHQAAKRSPSRHDADHAEPRDSSMAMAAGPSTRNGTFSASNGGATTSDTVDMAEDDSRMGSASEHGGSGLGAQNHLVGNAGDMDDDGIGEGDDNDNAASREAGVDGQATARAAGAADGGAAPADMDVGTAANLLRHHHASHHHHHQNSVSPEQLMNMLGANMNMRGASNSGSHNGGLYARAANAGNGMAEAAAAAAAARDAAGGPRHWQLAGPLGDRSSPAPQPMLQAAHSTALGPGRTSPHEQLAGSGLPRGAGPAFSASNADRQPSASQPDRSAKSQPRRGSASGPAGGSAAGAAASGEAVAQGEGKAANSGRSGGSFGHAHAHGAHSADHEPPPVASRQQQGGGGVRVKQEEGSYEGNASMHAAQANGAKGSSHAAAALDQADQAQGAEEQHRRSHQGKPQFQDSGEGVMLGNPPSPRSTHLQQQAAHQQQQQLPGAGAGPSAPLHQLHELPNNTTFAAVAAALHPGSVLTTASQRVPHALQTHGSLRTADPRAMLEAVPQVTEIHGAFAGLAGTAAEAFALQLQAAAGLAAAGAGLPAWQDERIRSASPAGPSVSAVMPQYTEVHGMFAPGVAATAAGAQLQQQQADAGGVASTSHVQHGGGNTGVMQRVNAPAAAGAELAGAPDGSQHGASPGWGDCMAGAGSAADNGSPPGAGEWGDAHNGGRRNRHHGQHGTPADQHVPRTRQARMLAAGQQGSNGHVDGGPGRADPTPSTHSGAAQHTPQHAMLQQDAPNPQQQPLQLQPEQLLPPLLGGQHAAAAQGATSNGHPRGGHAAPFAAGRQANGHLYAAGSDNDDNDSEGARQRAEGPPEPQMTIIKGTSQAAYSHHTRSGAGEAPGSEGYGGVGGGGAEAEGWAEGWAGVMSGGEELDGPGPTHSRQLAQWQGQGPLQGAGGDHGHAHGHAAALQLQHALLGAGVLRPRESQVGDQTAAQQQAHSWLGQAKSTVMSSGRVVGAEAQQRERDRTAAMQQASVSGSGGGTRMGATSFGAAAAPQAQAGAEPGSVGNRKRGRGEKRKRGGDHSHEHDDDMVG